MTGRTKGWIIIGVDLLLVLGVYFIYTQFRAPADTPPGRVRIQHEEIRYSMTVDARSERSYELSFSIANPGSKTIAVRLPDGVQLLLSDGRKLIFWEKKLELSPSLDLSPGEERSWRLTAPAPAESPGELYAGFYIDEPRQGMLEIPGSGSSNR